MFNLVYYSIHTILYIDTPVSLAWHVPSCNNAGYLYTSYTTCKNITSILFLHHSPYIIGYPWPTYIRWRVTYHLPLTQSLKNCISIAGLIQYATSISAIIHCTCIALAADAHACTLIRKKKHVISRYRTCDLLTWSQKLF